MNTSEQNDSIAGNGALVEARGLSKSYQLGKISVPALSGVDFTIQHGEFVAVEGPSGSGKTTLLNLIGAIDVPTGGDATYGLAAGDLTLQLYDDAPAWRSFDIPAVAVDTWTWVEVDISSLAAGTGDAITQVAIRLSTQGNTNLGAFSCWIDGMYKWDADDEEALGADISEGGLKTVLTLTTANTGDHTQVLLAEYTDYFVNYQTGNDVIVTITDQSANSGLALVGY